MPAQGGWGCPKAQEQPGVEAEVPGPQRPCCPGRACPSQSHSRRFSCRPPLWCVKEESGPGGWVGGVVVVVVVDGSKRVDEG